MIFRQLALLATITCMGTAASAAVYDCDIDSKKHNWLPTKLYVSHSSGSGTATVNDPLINHFNGKPMGARVKHDNDKRITWGWTLKTVSPKGQRANMVYRATYLKSSGKISIVANPNGYSNKFSASGTCTVK